MPRSIALAVVLAASSLAACSPCSGLPPAEGAARANQRTEDGDVVNSLLGRRLVPTPLPPEEREKRRQALADAEARLDASPDDAEAQIWVGRRMAYLGRYRDAIAAFSRGLARHPDDARFLRHRGHRYITLRRLSEAVSDLSRAAELIKTQPDAIEPDGQPNAKGVPLTTLHSNVHYHLGLAHYLRGDFAAALPAYEACARAISNDDHLVSSTYWRYLTLQRLGRHAEAKALLDGIPDELSLLENRAYHRLLLFYQGRTTDLAPGEGEKAALDDATLGYGLGAYHLAAGHPERAREIFQAVTQKPMWAAFGAIAAEAELARSRSDTPASARPAVRASR